MSTIDQFFTERGVPIDEDLVLAALSDLLEPHLAAAGGVALPEAEVAFLDAHAGVRPTRRDESQALAATTASVTELVARARTVDGAAALAGVHPSRVRHWIGDGTVHAMKIGGRNLLPSWQFGADGRPVAHLGEVLAALPSDLHPLSLAGFFTAPVPELEIDDRGLSPLEWLASGGDPVTVVALARSLAVLL